MIYTKSGSIGMQKYSAPIILMGMLPDLMH